MNDYEQMAIDFAKKYGVKLSILDIDYRPFFDNDKESRYVFKCRLTRQRKSYTFCFGQSIYNRCKEPTMYEILSCLQKSSYPLDTFEDFCGEYGYDTDSRRAERTYKACVKEYNAVVRLFGSSGDCYDELCEIC